MFRKRQRLAAALLWGILAVGGLLGVCQLIWAAVPSGAPVVYTGTDAVTLPTPVTFTSPTVQASAAFLSQGSSAFTGDISPTTLTGNVNDYNPTGLATASVLRLSSSASWQITGLQGGSDGRVLLVMNVGTQNIVLPAESGSSSAANRFDFTGDLTVPPKGIILLTYDSTSSRWRTLLAVPPAGPLSTSVLTMTQQGADPAVPASGFWTLYAKAAGIFARDSIGNIFGPFGTGGGGGPSAAAPVVRLATTANINLSLEQPIDGVTTNGTRVLVKNQTTASQNGIYVSSPSSWQRANDFDVAAEFTEGFVVSVTDGTSGTGNKNTLWQYATLGGITLNTTPLTFTKVGLGPTGELLANRSTLTTSTANGTIGSDAGGRVPWNRAGSYAVHGDIGAGSQVTPTAQTMGIQSSTASNIDLTGNPRITGCTAATDGIHLSLVGLDATKTVTIPNGQGVLLAGNLSGTAGAVRVGRAPGGTSATFRCNGATTTWEQVHVPTLQQAKNAGRDLDGMVDEATGMRRGDISGGTYCVDFGATTKCYCAGVPCATSPIANAQFTTQGTQPTCAVGLRFLIWVTPGVTGAGATADKTEICDKDASDVYAWKVFGAGAGANTACVTKDSLSDQDDNRIMGSVGRAITVTSVWCHYEGTAPTLGAQFGLVGMTHTAPTCAAPTAAATAQTVTAGGAVATRTPIRFSVNNTPNPNNSQTYELCVAYAVQ